MFLFAMRSPKTREKCTGRLRMFFDFAGILPEDTMIKRSMAFCEKSKSDNAWAPYGSFDKAHINQLFKFGFLQRE
jgi:hypothetical protein